MNQYIVKFGRLYLERIDGADHVYTPRRSEAMRFAEPPEHLIPLGYAIIELGEDELMRLSGAPMLPGMEAQ